MKKLLCALAVVAIAAPGIALAGGGTSCAAPSPIFSNSSYSGDTSDNPNTIGAFGPLSSTGPDAIYSFVAPAVATDPIQLTLTGGFAGGGAIYLTAICAGDSGTPIQVDAQPAGVTSLTLLTRMADGVTPLTPGTLYYVTVTNSPADNAGGSGTYSMVTGTLPVALQSFMVD